MGGDQVGHDAIIVGGGPAGSVTGLLLARAGYRVLLLDRHEFPRSKPCGESINPGAVGQLRALGLLPDTLVLPHHRIGGWQIHPTMGEPFRGRFPDGIAGLAIDRAAFDAFLLRAAMTAGVTVETGVRVTDILTDNGRVMGVTTGDRRRIPGRLVVGADGLRSIVARRLGLVKRAPKLRKVALTAHVAGAMVPEGTGVLQMTPWGCAGLTRLGDGTANVVLMLERGPGVIPRGDPAGCFDRLIGGILHTRGAVRTNAVMATGPFDVPIRTITVEGALLVGDAAGYFDPFTGQGIYRALLGARHAAAVASECLADDLVTRRGLLPYERRHQRAFTSSVVVQRLIEFALARPSLFDACAARLRAHPAVADRLLAVTADIRPPASLLGLSMPGSPRIQ